MRQFIYIIFLQLLFITAKAGSTVNIQQPPATTYTSIITETIDDAIIAEVIKTKAPPEKEKVQYFSQVTKYGFKNLFAKYNYNPALPYSSQVNPHAES